jgi:hypothetical protein
MIREYARERLAHSGEEEERRERHARFFLMLAETAERAQVQTNSGRWLDRLERELDNLRAALAWSVEVERSDLSFGSRCPASPAVTEPGPKIELPPWAPVTHHHPPTSAVELGLRLGSALQGIWYFRGHVREGRTQHQRLLYQPGAAAPTAARARALQTAAMLSDLLGEAEPTRELCEESLAIWRHLKTVRALSRGSRVWDLWRCPGETRVPPEPWSKSAWRFVENWALHESLPRCLISWLISAASSGIRRRHER